MRFLELLGRQLKDPLVINFLEADDLEVIYSFDRLFENQPDEYFVAANDLGIEMIFNADQILHTIFFYIEPDGEFCGCDTSLIGLDTFQSRESAAGHCDSNRIPFQTGETDFLGIYREWIKLDRGKHFHHLEFRNTKLHKMTAMLKEKAEQCADGDAEEAV